MLKRRLSYIWIILFFSAKVIAQVNLQTGSATFSVPIFNWQDDKSKLNSVIALSYNSGSGLSVNEVASSIGQGWNMVAGGVITRMQVGLPDDQVARTGSGIADITKYPAGILYATTQAYKGCPTALTKYPIFGWKNQIYTEHNEIAEDKELDYFSFQFNGKAGQFVLDPTNLGTGIFIGDTKMKVTFQQDAGLQGQGIRTKITSFTIQDINGLKYKFALHGKTKVLETNYCDANLNRVLKQPDFKNEHVYHQTGFENAAFVNPYIIGSWFLTEVEDPLTQRKIFFHYATRDINSTAGEDIMYNVEKDYSIIYHKKSITQTPVLDSITYPDGHGAKFKYQNTTRFDLNGDFALSNISISYQGRYLSRHELNTTYVMLNRVGTPVSDYQKRVARLYLKSVRKIGPDLKEDSPPYIFDYYLGSSTSDDFVPPPFFYAKDVWGYFNGSNSAGYWNEVIPLNTTVSQLSPNEATLNKQLRGLCFQRTGVSGIVLNAKPDRAKNGLLRQIIYPTGGTLTYEYSQNTGVINGNSTNVGGVHVSSTSSTDGGYSNGCSNPITTNYNYILAGGASSLWGLEMPVNATFSTTHFEPEWRYYKWTLGCFPFGCCDWKFKFPGIISQQQMVSLTDFQQLMSFLSPVLDIINVIGTINDFLTAISASGNPLFLIIDIIVGLVNLGVTCIGNQARDNDHTTFYNFNLNSVSPLPSQFKRVEIIEGTGGIGKTVQEFTSSDDYAVWENTNQYFTSKQRFASWAYGLPKKTTVFDVSGNKVRETENIYSYANAKQIIKPCNNDPEYGLPPCYPTGGIPSAIVSCNCTVRRSISQRNTDWSNPSMYNNPNSYNAVSNNDLKVDFYGFYSGRVTLSTSYERFFKPNDQTQFSEAVSEFEYTLYNYDIKKTIVTQSNGDKIIKETSYSAEYFGGVPYITLQNNNILNVPINVITSIIKAGTSTSQDLSETKTNLVQLSNGDIKPGSISETRSDKPYNRYSISPVQTQTFTYDAAGNLIGLKDEGNRVITNLYGYNDKYVVASIINADPLLDNCSYASFEDPTGWIGWTLTGTAAYNTTVAMTGVRSFALSPSTTFSKGSLNTSKAYTLTFWSTAAISVTGGATLIKSAPTINGFTYYEYDIVQGTSSVSLTGTATIDELRLYPKVARMRSIAYDPIIGKISECDENNRITYYEYDNLGRLKVIKDQDRNIVKMYEYNNVSPAKQNGCPGTYYNKMISEVFTKNCGTGYLGSQVTYTVAANTYSSTISQADADAQAENNILTNGQNYANTNGNCTQLYYNTVQSQNFTTENCPIGYIGGTVTYSVPANSYSSIISQAAANQLALDEITSNGQAYANEPANSVCTITYDPIWTWLEGSGSYCSGGHLFILETDINPYSSTYNTTRWTDVGTDDSCPPVYVTLYYANNTSQDQYITVTNVATNAQYFFYAYAGLSGILGDVPEGTYDITISDGYGYYMNNYVIDCGYYTTGYGATFSNVPLNSSCYSFTITPWYY